MKKISNFLFFNISFIIDAFLMFLPTDLENQLPPKSENISGLVYYPKNVDFGVIKWEGIYCIPFVMAMRQGANYSYYIDLLRIKDECVEVSDVCFCYCFDDFFFLANY
jgi:hypothetical protein